MDSLGAGIKPNGEGTTGTEELNKKAHGSKYKGRSAKGPLKKSSSKPVSDSSQAIKPGNTIKKLKSTNSSGG